MTTTEEPLNNPLNIFDQFSVFNQAQILDATRKLVRSLLELVHSVPVDMRAGVWSAIEDCGGKLITKGITAHMMGKEQAEIIDEVLGVLRSSPFLTQVMGTARDEFAR
jgi:hypothetical protein